MSDMELQFTCPSCASVIGVDHGDYIQCRCCGNKYKKKIKELLEGRVYTDLSHAVEARQEADFDTARDKYDTLINRYQGGLGTEEAYWGKLLCEQYVIFYQNEYGDSIPSFWEINDTPCTKSESYKKALEYGAESGNRENYERLAKLIETYKQKYRAVKKADPEGYQVFICFKDSGTNNAQLGYNLYNQLSRHYKVFFSKESLKTLVGNDYEPTIYHAMRTAKVMLVLCSSREHLDSQWVKNEWWRFAKFCENDSSQEKTLIPLIMPGFDPGLRPNDLKKNIQYLNVDHNLTHDLFKRLREIFDRDHARITVQMNDFEKDMRLAEEDWNAGRIDEARMSVDRILKENIDKPNNHVTALLLQAKIFSNGYKRMKDERAVAVWAQVEEEARRHSVDLQAKEEYRRYRKKIAGKRVKTAFLAIILALALAGATVGIILAVRDPLTGIYVTGNPQTVEVEYGSSYLDKIPTITTVSQKGKEKQIDLNSSMVSGFDPTKIGMQTVTISYEGMTVEITINVVKYSLSAPTGLAISDGRITWAEVPKAESYTVQINDYMVSDLTQTSCDGTMFTEIGVYSVRVKAIADPNYGKDSDFSEYLSVVCLAEASNLKLEGTTLSWDAVAGCTGYDLYMNGEKLTTVAANNYAIPLNRFENGINHFYAIPIGAKNVKAVADLGAAEKEDYEHNSELTLYKFEKAGGAAYMSGTLTWTAVSGATGYQVYVNGALAAETAELTYAVDPTKMKAGDNAVYVLPVGACNLVANADPNADFVNHGVITIKKLAPVSGVSLSSNALTWSAVEGATHYDVLVNGVVVTTTSETSYTLPQGSDTENSRYEVRATAGDNVIPSDVADGKGFTKLNPPTNVAISQTGILTWAAVAGATKYEIYLGDALLDTVNAGELSYDVAGKVGQGTHRFSVAAVGNGSDVLSSNRSAVVEYVSNQTTINITNEDGLRQMFTDQTTFTENDRKYRVYVLKNNITLTSAWTPVGSTAAPFVSGFDGAGFEIIGMNVTATNNNGTGFFGNVGENAVIKNVTFRNATVNGSSRNNVGVVAGINKGTIHHVTVYGTVTSTGDYIGGIAGRTYGSVYNCKNYASVTGDSYVGGICGRNDAETYNLMIHSCENLGQIAGTSDVGGIFGVLAIGKKMTVYGMVNSGAVTASASRAGGLFGQITGSAGQMGTVESCSNSGNVTAADYAGGCFGKIGNYITVVTQNVADPSKNCTNTGTVTATSGSHRDEIGGQ